MKTFFSTATLFFLCATAHVRAAALTGTVSSVNGDTAMITMDGDVMPAVGSKAEIYFKIAGADEEISVATGTAGQIDHGELRMKIENATGAVEKGQLVRFSGSANTSGVTSTPAAAPANKPSSNKPSLVGEWHKVYPPVPITFRPDGTVQMSEANEQTTANYRVDDTQQPRQIDLFAFSNAPEAQKDVVLKGIFKIENDTFYFNAGEVGEERPTEFNKNTEIGVRDRNGPAPTSGSPLLGTWNVIKSKETYTFTADGKLHTHWESSGADPDDSDYRYELDESTKPMRLNFYYREVNGNPSWRGIVEFESDTRMRLDGQFTSKEEERPKTFRDKAEVFTRGSPASP